MKTYGKKITIGPCGELLAIQNDSLLLHVAEGERRYASGDRLWRVTDTKVEDGIEMALLERIPSRSELLVMVADLQERIQKLEQAAEATRLPWQK